MLVIFKKFNAYCIFTYIEASVHFGGRLNRKALCSKSCCTLDNDNMEFLHWLNLIQNHKKNQNSSNPSSTKKRNPSSNFGPIFKGENKFE
jgi:hypothetical protein